MRRPTLALFALLLAACSPSPTQTGTTGGCLSAQQSCRVPSDCCGGLTCAGGVCTLASANGAGNTSSGPSSASGTPSTGTSGSATGTASTTGSTGGRSSTAGTATASSSTTSTSTAASTGATTGTSTTSTGSTASTSTTSTSTTTGGTTSVSSTSGGTTGANCAINPSEFSSCSTAPCPAGLDCVNDPQAGQPLCEAPCAQLSDCANASDICVGGHCTLDFCGPNTPNHNGLLDGPCTVSSPGDGTCYAIDKADGGAALFGLCFLSGPLTGSGCDPNWDNSRCTVSTQCAAGETCLPSGSCAQLCDPSGGVACFNGQACSAQSIDVGICPGAPGTTSSTGTSGGTTGGGCSQGTSLCNASTVCCGAKSCTGNSTPNCCNLTNHTGFADGNRCAFDCDCNSINCSGGFCAPVGGTSTSGTGGTTGGSCSAQGGICSPSGVTPQVLCCAGLACGQGCNGPSGCSCCDPVQARLSAGQACTDDCQCTSLSCSNCPIGGSCSCL